MDQYGNLINDFGFTPMEYGATEVWILTAAVLIGMAFMIAWINRETDKVGRGIRHPKTPRRVPSPAWRRRMRR